MGIFGVDVGYRPFSLIDKRWNVNDFVWGCSPTLSQGCFGSYITSPGSASKYVRFNISGISYHYTQSLYFYTRPCDVVAVGGGPFNPMRNPKAERSWLSGHIGPGASLAIVVTVKRSTRTWIHFLVRPLQ